MKPTSQVDPQGFLASARGGDDVDEDAPVIGSEHGLLGQLPLSCHQEVLAVDVEQTGRRLDENHAHRMTVLPHHRDAVLVIEGDDAHRAGMAHVLTIDVLPGRGDDSVIDEVAHPTGGLHLVVNDLPALVAVPALLAHLSASFLATSLAVSLGASLAVALACSTAAATSPRNSGWACVGRDLSSGWAWVATKYG